jgi:hypothetical protein
MTGFFFDTQIAFFFHFVFIARKPVIYIITKAGIQNFENNLYIINYDKFITFSFQRYDK